MKKSSTQTLDDSVQHLASFRDPAGFVFGTSDGRIRRQINSSGAADFEFLHTSKLYDALVAEGLLVTHRTIPRKGVPHAHAIIEPEQIAFISYPFEWSFSQLQDAALATLRIQKIALIHGMSLKDASAYNIQFLRGKPILIDTLSFEKREVGMPWKAYRQFCQHFLAPLSLMAYTDVRLSQLFLAYIDGIPLDMATRLLPRRARLQVGLMMHLFLHSKAQAVKASEHRKSKARITDTQLRGIVESLERTVRKLKPLKYTSEWADYYNNTNYSADAADQKSKSILRYIQSLPIETALDVGGNNGTYSRVLNQAGVFTICSDIDPNAVEANYRYAKKHGEQAMLPLVVDFTNPGGALGWANQERDTVADRFQTDLVMALAVVHHLAISNNLPLAKIAAYLTSFSPYLILEFVPKTDSQVQKLLATREDIFPDYHEAGCRAAFLQYYRILQETKIKGTKRTLFLFKRK